LGQVANCEKTARHRKTFRVRNDKSQQGARGRIGRDVVRSMVATAIQVR